MKELIVIEGDKVVLESNVVKEIIELQKEADKIKSILDEYKEAILKAMEFNNILKVDNDSLTISYIAPTQREDFDKKKFKEDHMDMYDEYIKFTPVKSSIRIKVK